jgi:hypothetical protein
LKVNFQPVSSFDLSAKGDPTSSYATDGIAIRVIGVLKLLYHNNVEAPTEEGLSVTVPFILVRF